MAAIFRTLFCIVCLSLALVPPLEAQSQSVARRWNEVLLDAIRADFARPTVHARNLFHASVAMYDAWAVYDDTASTYFLNHSFRHFYCSFEGITKPEDIKAAQEEAISYAAYRLLSHRFKDSPGAEESLRRFRSLMTNLGYDPEFTSADYRNGPPAALGNYIAKQLIAFGLEDGSNEGQQYRSMFYRPVNQPLNPFMSGNQLMQEPNHWQPLALPVFVDQGGIETEGPPPFLSPEWGKVVPFALKDKDLKVYTKNGNPYRVYHDPGPPPALDVEKGGGTSGDYAWNFSLVPVWASHLDPSDSVMIDISPASLGNIQNLPETAAEYRAFYEQPKEGYLGPGYEVNPHTAEPYQAQYVPRGDYTRVLAEFWADGPESETPPGHWFTILNYVNNHPLLEKKIEGRGPVLDKLEWDVKTYFTLGGALHDAAVSAWGVKGYYDYVRPVSAVRYMAGLGQSSDPGLPNYHPAGIPLLKGYIELVGPDDPLANINGRNNINKVKLYTWRGPFYRENSQSSHAGAGWILAENWWPYQQPTFVTPPFAGYVSGHSTFSRAAAEVIALLTGSEYFPGGMGEFIIRKNRFLRFETGPGVDIKLQWAKYKDASDQCSLSRIWGGIHPPADDIPGRKMGQKTGIDAFYFAKEYFEGNVTPEEGPEENQRLKLYPNPLAAGSLLTIQPAPFLYEGEIRILNITGQVVYQLPVRNNIEEVITIKLPARLNGLFLLQIQRGKSQVAQRIIIK